MHTDAVRAHVNAIDSPPQHYGPAVMFCPGDRPERFAKALAVADQVILDLEDAVAPDQKDRARHEVVAAMPDLDLDRVIVRVNPLAGERGRADLEAVSAAGVRHVMVPKAEPGGLDLPPGIAWIALCETALGVLSLREVAAAPGVAGLTWGSEDLAVSMAARKVAGLDELQLPHLAVVRGTVPLVAVAAGVAALDRVYLDLEDTDGLHREALQAAAMGYRGKLALHPRQVEPIRAAFLPTEEEIAEAREVLEAAADAGGRAFAFRGRMVDEPLIAQARLVVSLADKTS